MKPIRLDFLKMVKIYRFGFHIVDFLVGLLMVEFRWIWTIIVFDHLNYVYYEFLKFKRIYLMEIIGRCTNLERGRKMMLGK